MRLGLVAAFVSVLSSHYGLLRNSSTTQESALTPASVSGVSLLGSYAVDGSVFSQPLIVQDVNVGGTYYDLMVTCTMNNSCYGFDANRPGSVPLWHTFMGAPITSYPGGSAIFYGSPIGCLPTPVIDPTSWMMYAVCVIGPNATPSWILYQMSAATGQIINTATITGQVPGTGMPGDTIVGGQLQFSPFYQMARGIVVANGNVYVSFSSHDDFSFGSWHGWVFSYSTILLTQNGIFCTTPNGRGGSIWQSNAAPAVDSNGNIYLLTGNGDYDGVSNWANSLLKFSPTLQVVDWFTPVDWMTISGSDFDLSSSRPLIIPGAGIVTFSFKSGNIYSLPLRCLGHLEGSSPCTEQKLTAMSGFGGMQNGVYSGAAYQNGTAYFGPVAGPIYEFSLSGSVWNTTPVKIGPFVYPFPGATMTITSQSGKNTLVWAVVSGGDAEVTAQQGTLYALDPVSLNPLWSSAIGTLAQLTAPTVANGKVYTTNCDGVIKVFGLASGNPVTLRKGMLRTGTLR